MKKYIERVEEQDTTTELTDWVGIVFDSGHTGIVVYIGDAYHIICSDTFGYTCSGDSSKRNVTCGDRKDDGVSIKDAIDIWKNDSKACDRIRTVYCFDTYKQLMAWFAEHIEE
jgi:hypothetical protein